MLREGADKHTAGSSSSTCSGAIQPTFLNSDLRTTSGDKSPFLSVSPRLLCQDCQQRKDGQSQQWTCTARARSPETLSPKAISHPPPPQDLYCNIFTFPFHPELEPWRSGKWPGLWLICFLQTWHLYKCFYLKWSRNRMHANQEMLPLQRWNLRTVEYSPKIKHFNHYLYSYLLLM